MVNLTDKSDLDVQYGKIKMKMRGASLGILFALFGAVLIMISVAKMTRFEEELSYTPAGKVVKRIIEKKAKGDEEIEVNDFANLTQVYNDAQRLHIEGLLPEAQRKYFMRYLSLKKFSTI
jgi:hypothetical protein